MAAAGGPWAVARWAPRPPPPRDEDEMRGGALASSSTDHGEGRTGAWRLEVWSSRGLGMGRPAVLGALGGGAAVVRERERPGAAPVARSYDLHAEELDPGADPHGSGRHRPRIRTRRPESSSPPCAPPRAAAAVSWSCPPAARLVLPAGRSPGPARRPLAPRRHASARARAAPPRPLRSAAPTWGEREGCAPWPPAAASQPLCGWW